MQPPPHTHTPIPSALQTGPACDQAALLPAASDISRLSRASKSERQHPSQNGGGAGGDGREETCLPGKRQHNSHLEQSGCGAGKSGLRGGALWSPAMVAKRPPGTAEVLCADSRAQAAPACLCSSALLPLPLPPAALHPQTQKHSGPGLSPAACSSPGFPAQRTAPVLLATVVSSKWPGQCPDTAVFSTEEGDNLQKNTAHLAPGDQRLPGAPGLCAAADHSGKGSALAAGGAG